MDLRKGRTTRRCIQMIPEDPLLKVTCDGSPSETLTLFGYEFSTQTLYSTKKKGRWQVPMRLTAEDYEEDRPVLYCQHQCLIDTKPVLDTRLFDSISGLEVGGGKVTDRRLKGGSFNSGSVVSHLQNRFDYTRKQLQEFDRSKARPQKKYGRSRKNHRPMIVRVPEPFEEPPQLPEHEEEKRRRVECVRIDEFVHVNNVRAINMLAPVNLRRTIMKANDLSRSKRIERQEMRLALEDDEDFNSDIEVLNISDEETIETRPFVLQSSDFLSPKYRSSPKKRSKKKAISHKSYIIKTEVDTDEEWNVSFDSPPLNLSGDLLPSVEITFNRNDFEDDLKAVYDSYRCWHSNAYPIMILVDIKELAPIREKSFLVLKPVIHGQEISVKVIFNLVNHDCDISEVFDHRFNQLKNLVDFVQSRLKVDLTMSDSRSRKMIVLDGKVDGVANLWKTKESKEFDHFYLRHSEWQSQEINDQELQRASCRRSADLRQCVVCMEDLVDEDSVTMTPCNHTVCLQCMTTHIVCRLHEASIDMICPGDNCNSLLDAPLILSLVSWKLYYRRLEILESSVISNGGCICGYCGSVLVQTQTDLKPFSFICVCGNSMCSRCGREAHFPSSCSQFTKYLQKMTQLKDIEIVSVKVKPLIFSGRTCPKCFKFVVKEGGCNHIHCVCGVDFCWGCGDMSGFGRHTLGDFPCFRVTDLVSHDVAKYSQIPGPSSYRPILYCMALHHQVNDKSYFSTTFYKHLQELLYFVNLPQSLQRVMEKIYELSRVIENIFVMAYQTNKRSHGNLLRFLRLNASVLLFYQQRIKYIVENSFEQMHGPSHIRRSPKSLRRDCHRLEKTLEDVQKHLEKFSRTLGR